MFDLEGEPTTMQLDISGSEITTQEVKKAINKLKNNKAAGLDKVTAELLKHGREVVVGELTHLFNLIWEKEEVPVDWGQGVIVTLPKKGSLSDCNNWRGITLLSVPGKAFCSVLLNRLKDEIDHTLRQEQAGFRSGRSCCEQIFTLRNIIEQSQEFRAPLLINYIDFKKAFDSIHRESLWKIAKIYGVPDKYINIFKSLYRSSSCCVRTKCGNTIMFEIVTGVRQGCILSPFLFLLVIDFIMKKTVGDRSLGIQWNEDRLTDLDFADDIALLSDTHNGLQKMTSDLGGHGEKVGLRISCEKTKAMIIGEQRHPPPITIGQHDIEYVENFPYLGSYISKEGDAEVDVRARIGKAASVFQRLRTIWKSGAISRNVKLRLYSSIVLPTAIYAGETWKKTSKISNKLDVFHRRCLRTILGVSWRDHVTNEDLMKMAGMEDLHDTVTRRRRKFAGHILRLPSDRPASIAINWRPQGGKRRRGRPRKSWQGTFREDLDDMGIVWEDVREIAGNRDQWRNLVAQCSDRSRRN